MNSYWEMSVGMEPAVERLSDFKATNKLPDHEMRIFLEGLPPKAN